MLRLDQLRIFGDRVLVDPDEKHAVSEGGLHIPPAVLRDNPNYYNMTGIVLQLGDGVRRHTYQCINCLTLAPQDEGPCPGCHQPLGNRNTWLYDACEARYPFGVDVGERVVFNRFAGRQVELVRDEEGQKRVGLMGPDPVRRYLIMRECEILGVVDGQHRIVPGYMAPKWGKVTEGLSV